MTTLLRHYSHVTRTRRNKSVAKKSENFQKRLRPNHWMVIIRRQGEMSRTWIGQEQVLDNKDNSGKAKLDPKLQRNINNSNGGKKFLPHTGSSFEVYRGRRKVYRKKNRHSKKKASLLFLSYTSDERPNGDHACRKEPRMSP